MSSALPPQTPAPARSRQSRWQFVVFRESVAVVVQSRKAKMAVAVVSLSVCKFPTDMALISESELGNFNLGREGSREASVGSAATMSAERMVVVLLYGPWARQVRKEGSRQDDGRLISTQIRRVKRFCLLCLSGLIISKLDPSRRRSLTVIVGTSGGRAANAPV